jgi:membrane protein DedA with SNARE-associated domain
MAYINAWIVFTDHKNICTCCCRDHQAKIPALYFLTVAGSIAWVLSFVLAGYFIGSRPYLKPWLTYIVIFFILFVTVPLLISIIKQFRKPKKEGNNNE